MSNAVNFFKNNGLFVIAGAIIVVVVVVFFALRSDQVDIPSGKAVSLGETTMSNREILVTDGTRHSIPLNEILSGGPGKDGIPSIDNPKFVSAETAGFLSDKDIGLGLIVGGEARFYPYQILVWHEIVNDVIGDQPVLVTYCPLCATGIVFERTLEGKPVEFGVSGMLWQSNLLMYNRTDDPEDESLWSQVLGEAVVGPRTGTRLNIVSADTVRWPDWQVAHPDTRVLSRDTGAVRPYGNDPYEGYYTSNLVSFGASFSDDRLGPKEFVLGIEMDGKFKAYHEPAIPVGTTNDTFGGSKITIERDDTGKIRMFKGPNREPLPYIGGFWFSWLAVHPGTELFK